MKTESRTFSRKTRATTAFLAAAAGLLILNTQAFAGGPSYLRLPVEGITPENKAALATLVREKLGSHLLESGDSNATVFDGHVQLSLSPDQPVTLTQIQAALAGSDFHIAADRLMLTGAVRFQIGAAKDPEKLAAALSADPETKVVVKELEDSDTTTILLVNHSRHTQEERAKPLLPLDDAKRIIREHGANLLAVTWGANPVRHGDEDFIHWFCRDPFGARIVPAKETPTSAKARSPSKRQNARAE